jgi:hypothetical protein
MIAVHGLEGEELPFPAVEEPRSAGLNLAHQLVRHHWVVEADTIIVDVSGLPSNVYFPVVAAILEASKKK